MPELPYVSGAPLQEEVLVPDPAVAGAEHERKPERPEQHAAQARVGNAFEHDVRDFTRSPEAGFEHHEPGLHEEHQERGNQHPHRVDRVDDVGRLDRDLLAEHRGPGLGTEVPSQRPHAENHYAEPDHLSAEIGTEVSACLAVTHSHCQGCDHSATVKTVDFHAVRRPLRAIAAIRATGARKSRAASTPCAGNSPHPRSQLIPSVLGC